jgi:hypothetical protein
MEERKASCFLAQHSSAGRPQDSELFTEPLQRYELKSTWMGMKKTWMNESEKEKEANYIRT